MPDSLCDASVQEPTFDAVDQAVWNPRDCEDVVEENVTKARGVGPISAHA